MGDMLGLFVMHVHKASLKEYRGITHEIKALHVNLSKPLKRKAWKKDDDGASSKRIQSLIAW